ncbi:winged helix-turn-helix domain-containing protein [Aestuariivirga sp. YIM B02566]|uniref:Response regulator transcription factor n=1 Tax=Taklimakanibacter albus TaxID=2800327 RepID=A0ACC5QYS5_9HYPH|nr:response regulator transcription factor [Aestuariivirga sp. YIM B02566]MBK1865356.1 response regulator transcription factor [Aestuariivirga sp. YIM B02566]
MQPGALKSRILVVDDDRRVCGFLGKFLGSEGYAVTAVHDGRAMRRALANGAVDLVILDLSFPSGEDGMTLARGMRSQYDLPLIVLSGKAATIDKVVCLELGADDYVTKPFEPRELLARIRTVLRRFVRSSGNETDETETTMRFAGWLLDAARYKLKAPDGREVRLTSQEFHILEALVRRRGRVLSREQILDIVANRDWTPYDRSIDVLIGKIRRKLEDDVRSTQFIKTVRGLGYMFAPPQEGDGFAVRAGK